MFRMSSLSLDYIVTLVLALVLAVKYIVFDCDDEPDDAVAMATATPAPVAMATAANGAVTKGRGASDGPSEQIVSVGQSDAIEASHCEATEDKTPTPSSLFGSLAAVFRFN